MQRLEVSGAVQLIYRSLGVKGIIMKLKWREQIQDVVVLIRPLFFWGEK